MASKHTELNTNARFNPLVKLSSQPLNSLDCTRNPVSNISQEYRVSMICADIIPARLMSGNKPYSCLQITNHY